MIEGHKGRKMENTPWDHSGKYGDGGGADVVEKRSSFSKTIAGLHSTLSSAPRGGRLALRPPPSLSSLRASARGFHYRPDAKGGGLFVVLPTSRSSENMAQLSRGAAVILFNNQNQTGYQPCLQVRMASGGGRGGRPQRLRGEGTSPPPLSPPHPPLWEIPLTPYLPPPRSWKSGI